mmetsp:Transcript_15760/g.34040  ORF Transcript_15760/g.34040 Transcript_15760/m.34040 type:complete len:80 (-) Transcript_15760:1126-1365(-)
MPLVLLPKTCPIIMFQPKCHPIPNQRLPPATIVFNDAATPPRNKFNNDIAVEPGDEKCSNEKSVDCSMTDETVAKIAAV